MSIHGFKMFAPEGFELESGLAVLQLDADVRISQKGNVVTFITEKNAGELQTTLAANGFVEYKAV